MARSHPKTSRLALEDEVALEYFMRVSGDQTKRSQFADAVVFEQLKRTATSDVPIVIFLRDKGFAIVTVIT